MPTARTRALSVCLTVALAAVLAGCGKTATFNGPAWGTPDDAINAGVEKLTEGFDFTGAITAARGQEDVEGSELPGDKMLSIVRSDSASTSVTRSILIGDELWVKYEGIGDFPQEWGHLSTGGAIFAAGSGTIGPTEWVPALLDEIVEVKRTGTMQYEGTLNFSAVEPHKTGIPSYQLDNVQNGDEVAFSVTLAADGHITGFAFTLEGPEGKLESSYEFTDYGAAEAVAPPTGKVTELTPETFVQWLLGDDFGG